MAMIADSLSANKPLPNNYHKLFGVWVGLGVPAFLGLFAVFFLMVAKYP